MAVLDITTKTCCKCGETKPTSEFYFRKDNNKFRPDCKKCSDRRVRSWFEVNQERRQEYMRQYYGPWYRERGGKEKAAAWWEKNGREYEKRAADMRRKYREENREDCNRRIRDWKSRNKAKLWGYSATRRAALLNAIPKWASLDKIHEIYSECEARNMQTGVKHHVDHIVPLVGRYGRVCGLHCEQNLQIITASENLKKNGYSWPDMP